jgi:hypothetical protein
MEGKTERRGELGERLWKEELRKEEGIRPTRKIIYKVSCNHTFNKFGEQR